METVYVVTITETLKKDIIVTAESPLHAEEIVEKCWKDGEYVLNSDDFDGVEFTCIE